MISILLCVTISFSAAASVTGDFELPRVTVNSWAEFKQALDNNPTGVEVVLGRTIIAGSGDSQLDIPEGCDVVLDLNGKTMNRNTLETGNYNRAFAVNGSLIIRDSAGGGRITGGHAWGGGCITVRAGGTFVLESGTLTQNEANGYGGAVYNKGTFTMQGGTITGNQAWGTETDANDGGGAIVNWGTFVMTGGTISNNIAYANGGGILNGGTALISGGSITGNQAREYNGGGINLLTNATIEDGVVIRGNVSDRVGGGINVYECHWGNITVTGNKASTYGSGAYISSTARIWLDRGGIVIADNEDDDAFLYKTAFHLSAPLTSARIGVDTASLGDAMTYGYSTHNGETNPNTFFSVRTREPEGEGLYVGLLNGEAARLSPVYYAVTARITGDGSGQVTPSRDHL